MTNQTPLLLVDGSSYLFRAFHAIPDLRTATGFPTGAIRGVVSMLRKLGQDYLGSPIAVVFDAKGKTFRDRIYPEYKANRPPMPPELARQIEPIHDIVRAMGLPLFIVPDVEADDVIGTLAVQATRMQRHTVISTSDKDMAQLVNEYVTLIDTMSDTTMDIEGVKQKFGVAPGQIIDYLALIGDKIDNVPGVPKVGPKTAGKWLNEYGTKEGVKANADQVKGKIGENLRASLDQLDQSYELVTIKCDVSLDVTVDQLQCQPPNQEELIRLFQLYQFKSYLEDMNGNGSTSSSAKAQYEILNTVEQLRELVAEIVNQKQVSVSIYTADGDEIEPRIIGIALCVEPTKAAYVPLGTSSSLLVPRVVNQKSVLSLLKPVFEDDSIVKVGRNLKHARKVLAAFDIALSGLQHDVMLKAFVLNNTQSGGYSTNGLAFRYLDIKAVERKDIVGTGRKAKRIDEVSAEELLPYTAEKSVLNLLLHNVLSKKLRATSALQKVYDTIEQPLSPVLARIEQNGTLLDRAQLSALSKELAARISTLADQAYELAGVEFNMGSPKQLQEILYDKLHLTAPRKTKTGHRSTAEDVLVRLEHEHELPGIVLSYRGANVLKSTFVDSLPRQIHPKTGRVHTTYSQAAATSGRVVSYDPNLQNIPVRTEDGRRIRQAFIAPEGYKLLSADYSQIELRVMAHISGDEGLKKAFAENLDIHRATAAEIFGSLYEDVSDEQRRSAKAINFGLIYGMSAFGLGRRLDLDFGVAKIYQDAYFERYEAVRRYMDSTRNHVRNHGYVETAFDRRLYVSDVNAQNMMRRQAAERTAINAPIQGSAADIIKMATIKMDDWLSATGIDARMIMQVHDELVFEVAEAEVDRLANGVRNVMSAAVELEVPLVVDIGIGNNWDEAH